jgi:hypothetical protein
MSGDGSNNLPSCIADYFLLKWLKDSLKLKMECSKFENKSRSKPEEGVIVRGDSASLDRQGFAVFATRKQEIMVGHREVLRRTFRARYKVSLSRPLSDFRCTTFINISGSRFCCWHHGLSLLYEPLPACRDPTVSIQVPSTRRTVFLQAYNGAISSCQCFFCHFASFHARLQFRHHPSDSLINHLQHSRHCSVSSVH